MSPRIRLHLWQFLNNEAFRRGVTMNLLLDEIAANREPCGTSHYDFQPQS